MKIKEALGKFYVKLGGSPTDINADDTSGDILEKISEVYTDKEGTHVEVSTVVDSGTKIATITTNNTNHDIYAPNELPSVTSADDGKILKVDWNGDWVVGENSGAPVRIHGNFNQEYTTFDADVSTFDEFKSTIEYNSVVSLLYNHLGIPGHYGHEGYIPYAYWYKASANSDDVYVFSGLIVKADGTRKNATITFTGSTTGVVTLE